jgi:hypothetical protein
MARYWLATHWPQRVDAEEGPTYTGVWAQDGKEHAIGRMHEGDLVFIFETQNGKTLVRQSPNGDQVRIPCSAGRGGVVALMRVSSEPFELSDPPEQYADGTQIWWRWHAETTPVNSSGFVTREKLNELLGYATGYTRFGGLRELTSEKFNLLLTEFVEIAVQREGVAASQGASRFGPGGEGPEHLALKNAVAADPSGLLGEDGLSLVQVEYPIITGDRVDIVLRDHLGRLVAVEIEVDCDSREMAGPLQAAKYRSLLAYLHDVPEREVRSMLVAHSVHDTVKGRCGKHRIEVVEVTRARVALTRTIPSTTSQARTAL